MSSSSSSLEKEIDEYQDISSRSEGSYESSESSTASNESSNEHYSRNYNVERLLHLGLARPDSHPALKTRRRKKILFIVVPLKWHPF